MAIYQEAQGADPGFTLDEAVLRERREVSARRVHVIQIPALRAIGFGLFCFLIVIREMRVTGSFPSRGAGLLLLLNVVYAAASWWLVRTAYGRTGRLDVGLVFLHLDVLVWLPNLHYLGQGNPLFAFFILVRVADQAGFGVRRALYFAHVLPLVYLGYGAIATERLPGQVSEHLAAGAIMYLLGVYLAATASVSERLRKRTRQAVRTARELVGRLEQKTQVLEAQAFELEHARHAAEQASVAKSQFLAMMSHELRTPLNGVIGSTDLLLATPLSPIQRRYAETAQRSAASLVGLIDDVLDLSRIEAGKLVLKPVPIDVRGLTLEVVELIGAATGHKPVHLHCAIDPAVPPLLEADPLRLRQVLINLLHNAVKFTDQGEVALHLRVFHDAPEASGLRFEVRDTGIGISRDQLDSVFDAFTQADASTTRRHGGSGLGLAIVRQLAGLMAGSIEVTSEPGRGSVFAFEVHLEKIVVPVAITEDVAAGAAPQWFGARVLLAEDDPVSQLIAAEMLKKLGCRVDVVSDGAAACRSVEQQHYDLVLMDCHMPGMDGYRATERIRHAEAAGSQRVAIVALTADAQSGNRERCIASGMDDFLCKPITFEALRRTLERWGR